MLAKAAMFVLTATMTLLSGSTPGVHAEEAGRDYSKAFELMKNLVGTWEAQGPNGTRRVTYHLTGGDSAIVETFFGEDSAKSSMSSVYHMDGPTLMATHYCGARNQPRFRVSSFDEGEGHIRFEYIDVTNLSSPSAYFTREIEITMRDENHLVVWFNGLSEGEEHPATYEMTRKQPSP